MPCAKVLLLETDNDLSRALTDVLTSEGLECCAASDPADASSLLDHGCAPCVAIIDVPEPPGLAADLFRRLRTEQRLRSVPVIVLTSRGADPVPGAAAVLAKPFSLEEILEATRRSIAWANASGSAESSREGAAG